MKQQPEFQLQCQVAGFLRSQFPRVMFLSDVRAATKLTYPQSKRSQQVQADDFACPDMMIFETTDNYSGMFLELKAESPFKRDGTLRKDEHLERQQRDIERLRDQGYSARFYWDYDQTAHAIKTYLKGFPG